jgi:chromosome segregation ATPase
VTFDGDDYNPGGFLTGGSSQNRAYCLSDMLTLRNLDHRRGELDAKLKEIDGKQNYRIVFNL